MMAKKKTSKKNTKKKAKVEVKKEEKGADSESVLSSEKGVFDVVPQDPEVLRSNVSDNQEENAENQEEKLPVFDKKELEEPSEKTIKAMINSIHKTGGFLLSKMSGDKFRISDQEIDLLNDAGVQLLNKYDDDGSLTEYAPEIAYGVTVLGIMGRYAVEVNKDKPKKKQDEKQEEPKRIGFGYE